MDEVLAAHCKADLVTECMKRTKTLILSGNFHFRFRPKMNVHFHFRFVFDRKWNFIFVGIFVYGRKWKMLFGRPLVYITKRSWSWSWKKVLIAYPCHFCPAFVQKSNRIQSMERFGELQSNLNRVRVPSLIGRWSRTVRRVRHIFRGDFITVESSCSRRQRKLITGANNVNRISFDAAAFGHWIASWRCDSTASTQQRRKTDKLS